jgi:hypothetical protein
MCNSDVAQSCAAGMCSDAAAFTRQPSTGKHTPALLHTKTHPHPSSARPCSCPHPLHQHLPTHRMLRCGQRPWQPAPSPCCPPATLAHHQQTGASTAHPQVWVGSQQAWQQPQQQQQQQPGQLVSTAAAASLCVHHPSPSWAPTRIAAGTGTACTTQQQPAQQQPQRRRQRQQQHPLGVRHLACHPARLAMQQEP